ncbi:MAG: hypothetical protein ACRDJV_00365 [Actinomycetota bacterium]
MSGQSKLYTSLASWWPLVSAPDEYEEEAGIYREQTAYAHCRPGGGVLFAPDHVRETFTTTVDHGGRDGDDRAVRYLEWTWDPDPADTSHVVDYAFLLRREDGRTVVEHDRHVNGLFPISTRLQTLSAVGFEARTVPFEHTELDDPATIFVGTRPELRPAATD